MDFVLYILVMYGTMSFIYDINAPRVKHRALTGYLRKNWNRFHSFLQKVVYNCDVSPYLGALPPQLRGRVAKENIPTVTAKFRENLEDFLIKNAYEIHQMAQDTVYQIPELGDLFGTSCVLETKGTNVYEVSPWSGASGFVAKLSFPEINAHYALKLYYKNRPEWIDYDHGVWFEVATALAANKAEPKDNNKFYMASLIYEKYMMTAWAGEEDGASERKNENPVFATSIKENEARNLRAGRRIDWGETYLTDYGVLTYQGRKLFRQIMNKDKRAVKNTISKTRNNIERRQMDKAIELADLIATYDENQPVREFIQQNLKVR